MILMSVVEGILVTTRLELANAEMSIVEDRMVYVTQHAPEILVWNTICYLRLETNNYIVDMANPSTSLEDFCESADIAINHTLTYYSIADSLKRFNIVALKEDAEGNVSFTDAYHNWYSSWGNWLDTRTPKELSTLKSWLMANMDDETDKFTELSEVTPTNV